MQVTLIDRDLVQQFWTLNISSSFNKTYAKIQELFAKKALTAAPALFSEQEILLSNVGRDIGKARIFYLLQSHNNPDPAVRLFNEAIIAAHYQKGDVILLESDCSKKPTSTDLKELAGLDPNKYTFGGWDAHGPCAKVEKEARFWTRKERLDYVIQTWVERQESLQKNTVKPLSYFKSNRVFVLMGPHHGKNDNPAQSPVALHFLPKMGYPFVIFDSRAIVSDHR